MQPPAINTASVTDPAATARLRTAARDNPRDPETLRAVARQFEALFTQMVLKSMRETRFGDSLLGEQGEHYRDLFDQQLALTLANGRGIGLADVLVRQLGGTPPPAPTAAAPEPGTPKEFIQQIWPLAERAGHALGVAPQAIVAQAALESGWGRHVVRDVHGNSSHNLFGIKADAGWRGARVSAPTLEAIDGVMVKRHEAFRAYESHAAAFDDYVAFVGANPRYRAALTCGADAHAFVDELQHAGYATDPAYAAKLRAILGGDALALKFADTAPLTFRPGATDAAATSDEMS